MGHRIRGLVGQAGPIRRIAGRHALAVPVLLQAGQAFVPLGADEHDRLFAPPSAFPDQNFVCLSDELLERLRAWSHKAGPIAYLETDYFGGQGTQAAIAVRDGVVVSQAGGLWRGPINAALAQLGVSARRDADAFQTVGLDQVRSTDPGDGCSDGLGVVNQHGVVNAGPRVMPAKQWQEIAARYATPARAYHSLDHVAALMREYGEVALGPGWAQPVEAWLAVLYHDAIYDAGRPDNETRSADLAVAEIERWLPEAGVDTARVADLIGLTAHHGRLTGETLDEDARHFLDCDMAILAAPPATFDAYCEAVAEEYSGVLAPDAYAAGRRQFLSGLLSQERIFLSAMFQARRERAARDNLARALAAQ